MREEKKTKKSSRLSKLLIIILLVCVLLSTFVIGYFFGSNDGQIFVAENFREKVYIVKNLSSPEIQSKMKNYFPEQLNYIQLFNWQSKQMNYSQNREFHTDPIEILDYGKGACLEYAVVYVASCLANDVPARLLVTGYLIPGKIDHAWAEVNPSKDGETWIHIEPADCAVGIQNGKRVDELTCYNNPSMHYNKDIKLVLAFEATTDDDVIIIDRTEVYNPRVSEQS